MAHIVSADTYFKSKVGEYQFDPSLLPQAHAWCKKQFLDACASKEHDQVVILVGISGSGKSTAAWEYTGKELVVDNTNSTLWELSPYVGMAEAYGLPFSIRVIGCDPAVGASRGLHGVSLTTCIRGAQSIEKMLCDLPPWWKVEMTGDRPETVVVTRHAGLLQYLLETGVVPAGTVAIPHATVQDVAGRHVVGILPTWMAREAISLTEVPMDIPLELRGKELTVEQVRQYAGKPVRYVVT